MAVRADVADDLDVQRMFAETIAAFGGIDVVVHAAGSRITASGVTKAGLDVFDALLRINTRATFVVNREAACSNQGHRLTGQVLRVGDPGLRL